LCKEIPVLTSSLNESVQAGLQFNAQNEQTANSVGELKRNVDSLNQSLNNNGLEKASEATKELENNLEGGGGLIPALERTNEGYEELEKNLEKIG